MHVYALVVVGGEQVDASLHVDTSWRWGSRWTLRLRRVCAGVFAPSLRNGPVRAHAQSFAAARAFTRDTALTSRRAMVHVCVRARADGTVAGVRVCVRARTLVRSAMLNACLCVCVCVYARTHARARACSAPAGACCARVSCARAYERSASRRMGSPLD